ncbi:MAG: platelet-activating factor acetylhydrolase IB subunit [Isosphaeraceae bacterium]
MPVTRKDPPPHPARVPPIMEPEPLPSAVPNRPVVRLSRLASSLVMVVLLTTLTGLTVCAQDPAVNTATKPEPRDGAWLQMHENFLEQARKGDIDLLFLGDSITRGWANDSEGGPSGIWQRHFAPRRAANFGIGGDRTQHLLWRLENGEVDGISPRVAVVMIGTNNANANTPAEIAEGVTAVVQTLRKKLPKTRVLLLGVFPRGKRHDAVRERLRAVNERIARLDDGGATVKYLDLGPHFVNPDGSISQDVMPDYLHLSRKGYRIWAEAMEPTLWGLFEEPSPQK